VINEAHAVFKQWENFYVITGSSSAALTGLVFVVVTLSADRRRGGPGRSEGTSIFSSPTIMHFCIAFLISGIFAAPWPAPGLAGTSIGLAGIFGVCYISNILRRAKRLTTYAPDTGDWIWFVGLPLATYLMITVAGFLLVHTPQEASFAIGAGTLLLIFIGIHNAWDVVTYLATMADDE
jgi:hypothetical protein